MADSADDKWEARAIKAEADAAKWRELHDRADHRAFAYSQRIEALLAALKGIKSHMPDYPDAAWEAVEDAIAKAEDRS